jgi:hypothetical protein
MDDLAGWQNTRWGMTRDEVLATVGPQNLARQHVGVPDDAWYCDYIIPAVSVGPYTFTIYFQMDSRSQKLFQVRLTHVRENPDCEPVRAFDTALHMLTERFGTPQRVGTEEEWEWAFATTTIRLSTLFVEGIVSDVHVIFRDSSSPISAAVSAF